MSSPERGCGWGVGHSYARCLRARRGTPGWCPGSGPPGASGRVAGGWIHRWQRGRSGEGEASEGVGGRCMLGVRRGHTHVPAWLWWAIRGSGQVPCPVLDVGKGWGPPPWLPKPSPPRGALQGVLLPVSHSSPGEPYPYLGDSPSSTLTWGGPHSSALTWGTPTPGTLFPLPRSLLHHRGQAQAAVSLVGQNVA